MVVTYVFLAAAAIAIFFSIVAIAHRSPVINVLSLVVVFFALAVIFAALGMGFLAAVQVVVYSGAILVLFLFVIMLLNIRKVAGLGGGRPLQAVLGAGAAVAIGWTIALTLPHLVSGPGGVLPSAAGRGTVFAIGHALLGPNLFAFELVSVLLAAAIVGAVFLARRTPQ